MSINADHFPSNAEELKRLILRHYGNPPTFNSSNTSNNTTAKSENSFNHGVQHAASHWYHLCACGHHKEFCEELAGFIEKVLRPCLVDHRPQMFNAVNAILQAANLHPSANHHSVPHELKFYSLLGNKTELERFLSTWWN